MKTNKSIKTVRCSRYSGHHFTDIEEKLINEFQLELFWQDHKIKSILTIEDDLDLLALGSYYSLLPLSPLSILEQMQLDQNRASLNDQGEIAAVAELGDDFIPVHKQCFLHSMPCFQLQSQSILAAFQFFFECSALFKITAGVHGAALMDEQGRLIAFFKDISRYNCLLKATGFMIKKRWFEKARPAPVFLFVSCRVNQQMIEYLNLIGYKTVVTRAAPSYQAVKTAEKYGLSLIGFTRQDRFTLFSQ